MSGSATFEIAVQPRSDDYDADDDRWRDQVAGLQRELRAHVDVEEHGHSVPGTKGGLVEVIVALGSAGAFTATVECLRAWLGRDRNRSIDVRWDEGGSEHFVTLEGAAVDAESVRMIARAAARRVGGPAWPADTEPS